MDDYGRYSVLIIIDPGSRHPFKTETYGRLAAMIQGRFDSWWRHCHNVFMVKSELNADEVCRWVNRVWPVPPEGGPLTHHTASGSSALLVIDITHASMPRGRLPSAAWDWLAASPPAPPIVTTRVTSEEAP